jgi:hypothetical protein
MAGTHTAPRAAAAADDGWRAVDLALDELERLAGDADEGEFYSALFARLDALGFPAAAVWSTGGDGGTHLERHSLGSDAEAARALVDKSHVASVESVIEGGEPKVISPSGRHENGALTGGKSIVAPLPGGEGAAGALQAWLAGDASPAATEGYARLVSAIAQVVGAFLARRQQQDLRQQLADRERLDALGLALHQSLEPSEVAYRLANEGRAAAGLGRVAVAVRRGNSYKILSVSGAEHIHRQAESVRQLERLCGAVARGGQPLWHPVKAEQLPPQIESELAGYLDLSPALAMAILPLKTPAGESERLPIGMLVCEQYKEPFSPRTRALVASMANHGQVALENALRVESIPAHRFWLAIGREGRLSRWAIRSLIAGAVALVVFAALALIPAELRIKAQGELQPAVRHEIFAPRDGVVTALHVGHATRVEKNDKLLELRSSELDLEMQRAAGELETTRKQLAAVQAERLQIRPGDADARLKQRRLTAEEEQLAEQIRGLDERQKMLAHEREGLVLRSPIDGEVVTWNAQQRLASRPLRRGDALLTIADPTGPWELELRVPSRQAGRLLAAQGKSTSPQRVSFVLATDPGATLEGTVKHIAERVEIDEAGESYLLVTVNVPQDLREQRAAGAAATARIECGRTNLAEAWFYELWDAARLWLPF